jgi:hypothetical protein
MGLRSGGKAYWTHAASVLRSGFDLTREEQYALLVVTGLFLLGLGTWAWHVRSGESPPPPAAASVAVPRSEGGASSPSEP